MFNYIIDNKNLKNEIRKVYKNCESISETLSPSKRALFSDNQLPPLSESEWQQEYRLIYESYKMEKPLND